MTWCNLNHLLLKVGLGFRELYLIEFPRKSRQSWYHIHYMLKGCQVRAFPSHFVKFLYFTSSKCYFSTLTNHFYNTTHIPLIILLLLYLYILFLFFILMLFLSLTPLSLSLSLSLSLFAAKETRTPPAHMPLADYASQFTRNSVCNPPTMVNFIMSHELSFPKHL